MPAISVAIACYNSKAFIGDTLRQLHRQSLLPSEIIVVDDGSTDASRAAIDAVGGVRVIRHHRNMGIAAARNTAWQNARGDIVTYLDADAMPNPDFLQTIAQGFEDPSVDGVGGRAVEHVQQTLADRWRAEVLFQHWGKRVRHSVPFLFGICASYRRSALLAAGGFDALFRFSGEDMDLGYRLTHVGHRLMYTPHALVCHMRNDDRHSIRQMAYRHCYGGFVAQRKNGCFHNKMTLAQGLRLLFRQVGQAARDRKALPYGVMTLHLHATMIRAWIDAQRAFRSGNFLHGHNARYGWEGYASQLKPTGNARPANKEGG